MPRQDPHTPLPRLVVHADWSLHPAKRWMAAAVLRDGRYSVLAPEPVGEPSTFLERMRGRAAPGAGVFAGFDFPIGLPARYARLAGIDEFLPLLPRLGEGEWSGFYEVAERPEQVSARRPFYPRRPGGAALRHLLDALGLGSADELLRECERGYPGRPPASPLFWTIGPGQVGKAAISGWRDLLAPALRGSGPDVAVWPFDGALRELLRSREVTVAETYPAEFYRRLGLKPGSKRNREDRRANAPILEEWAGRLGARLTPQMSAAVEDGFGPGASGEDPFDAAVGLLGMLAVALGHLPPGDPPDPRARRVEGWILGRPPRGGAREASAPPAEYDPLADLYDREYAHDHDVPFWLALAGREGGPVVEWGAGTGRIAVPLAGAGHDVAAVELSEAMAARGRKKGGAIEWIVGDMRGARLGRAFRLAVCAFNSFLCLLSVEDALAFLRNAREHLVPGGLLGVEVSAFAPEELADPPGGATLRHDLTRKTPEGRLERFSVSRYDAASQLLEMRLFYELYGESGELESRRAHDLTVRVTGRDELLLMLRLAGFEVEAVYGGFEGEPFTAASDHLIVLARRS